MPQKIKVLLADDHQLFRKGLSNILNQAEDIEVVAEATDGYDVLRILESSKQFDLILLDVNMPNMNGVETVGRLRRRAIEIPVLMLSMEENERTILQLVKLGVRGYILKDASPDELKQAIRISSQNKYFVNNVVNANLLNDLVGKRIKGQDLIDTLTDREIEFLKFCASESTYKEIATEMNLSPRTLDGYRDSLFEKLQAKSRVGLALFAVKLNLIQVKNVSFSALFFSFWQRWL